MSTATRPTRTLPLSVAVPLLLWLGVLALRAAGNVLPVAGAWEGGTPLGAVVDALAVQPHRVLVGGPAGLHISADQGASWDLVSDLAGQPVSALATTGSRVFAAGPGRLWEETAGGWLALPPPAKGEIRQLLLSEGRLLAATEVGLFARPIDSAADWRRLWPPVGEPPDRAHAVHMAGGRLLVGTSDGVVEQLPGDSWHRLGPAETRVLSVAVGGDWVHAAVAEPGGGLMRAPIGSNQWQAGRVDSSYGATILVDPRDPSLLYAGLAGLADGQNIAGVVASEDAGATWRPVRSRLLNVFVPALGLDETRNVIHAGTNGGGVFRYRIPTPVHRAREALTPVLELAEPVLLGVIALALFLQRRPVTLRRPRAHD